MWFLTFSAYELVDNSKILLYTAVGNPARTEELDLKSITLVLHRPLFFCPYNKCTKSACPAAITAIPRQRTNLGSPGAILPRFKIRKYPYEACR